jgi:N-acetylmuramoyl-L-alanine amidase
MRSIEPPARGGFIAGLAAIIRFSPAWFCLAWFCPAVRAAQTPPAPQSPPAPQASTPAPQPSPSRFVVVLDAAHGGDDTGGRFTGNLLEKDLTLAFSVRLRSLLGARGIQVVTTRERDAALDPDQRAAIANHAASQACLVLHATASGRGIHLYVSSLAPAPAARFAAWKTAQSASVARSLALAGVINGALVHSGMTVLAGRVGMPGLDSLTCPAVAVEIAPERTAGEGEPGSLDDADYQARVAGALAAALLEWRSEARQP